MIGQYLGTRNVKISSLLRTGSKKDRAREREENALSGLDASVKVVGMVHLPIVRRTRNAWQVVAGEHRITAADDAGEKSVEVRMWRGTDEEMEVVRSEENVRRGHLRGDALVAAIDAATATLSRLRDTATEESSGVAESESASTSHRVKARAAVAKLEGKSHAAVARADQRAAKSDGPGLPVSAAQQPGEAEPSEPCLDLLGCEAEASFLEFAASEQAKYDEADKHLRQAVRWVGMIEDARAQQELTAQVQRVGSLVRSARPAVLCPWCKDLPLLIKQCPGCRSIGYVSAETAKRAPRECTDLKAPVVCVNGNFFPYAEAKGWKAIPGTKNGKPSRSISVETTDGAVLSGHELTIERDE